MDFIVVKLIKIYIQDLCILLFVVITQHKLKSI